MGLDIHAVNNKFRFNKDGELRKGSMYYDNSRTASGYSYYRIFREHFISWLTQGDMNSFDDVYKYCSFTRERGAWYDRDTYEVLTKPSQIQKEDDVELRTVENAIADDIELEAYFDMLGRMKKEYPKLYDAFPMLFHSDCEGYIPYKQLKAVVPHLRRWAETDGCGYKEYIKDYLNSCEIAILNKGKLYYN